jgi:hypothetical protein
LVFGRKRGSRLLGISGEELAEFGYATYGGDDVAPDYQRTMRANDELCATAYGAVSRFVSGGSQSEISLRAVVALHEAGNERQPWGVVGAYCVDHNLTLEKDRSDPGFVDLMRAAFVILRSDGVSSSALPRTAASGGYEGVWPSHLEALERSEGDDGPPRSADALVLN